MAINFRTFILAGKAIFTISNGKGEHYTFKVRHSKGNDRYGPAWWADLLTGPDNQNDYQPIGKLDGEMNTVNLTRNSKFNDDTKPVKVLRWALKKIWANEPFPAGYAIQHEGRCARCAAPLTVPSSIDSGFGPECVKKVMKCS